MAEDPALLGVAVQVALFVAASLTLAAAYRVVTGPTVPDRVVGLDVIGTNVVAIGVLVALQTGRGFYVDVSIVLAIIGFLSTVAVARFVVEGDIIQ
ncbi:MAG: monovalent cation/H+ antiporter complex subunit F [Halobacteriaceae archaeon]